MPRLLGLRFPWSFVAFSSICFFIVYEQAWESGLSTRRHALFSSLFHELSSPNSKSFEFMSRTSCPVLRYLEQPLRGCRSALPPEWFERLAVTSQDPPYTYISDDFISLPLHIRSG